jgi:putative transposase
MRKVQKKVINDAVSDYAKETFIRIGTNYHITLMEWNHDSDHIYILFKAHSNSELSKFINAYKSASSRFIKKDFQQVREKLWKEMF